MLFLVLSPFFFGVQMLLMILAAEIFLPLLSDMLTLLIYAKQHVFSSVTYKLISLSQNNLIFQR
jgi:hypothetical protein